MANKKTFQGAMSKSVRYKSLFDKTLETKIQTLAALGVRAEEQFWALQRSEFQTTGKVELAARVPRLTASTICGGALGVLNDILEIMATIVGETHAAVSWTSSKKTLYHTSLSALCLSLYNETRGLREMMEQTDNLTVASSIADGFLKLYSAAKAGFQNIGPNFPTPICSFMSANKAETKVFVLPLITAKINASGFLELRNYNRDGELMNWGATGDDSAFHTLGDGDSIYIEKLEVSGYEEFVGMPNLVIETAPANGVLVLSCAGEVLGSTREEIESDAAATLGDVFCLRKLVSVA